MEKLSIQERKNVELTPVAIQLLQWIYLRRDAEGNPIETPAELFGRVARNVAAAELLHGGEKEAKQMEEAFYDAMAALEFLPNSPTLMNAGRELQQLSACFVLPVEDSIESIFETMKQTALIHQSGGGTGFSFSRLRPKDDLVRSSGGRSSGPISFIRVFDQATEAINQGGFRRGANMAVLRVDHPDILEFISAKADGTSLTNFNISVGVTDLFMEAVEKGEPFELINPRTQTVVKRLPAGQILDTIAQMAWQSGEPGVLFLDRMNAKNPTPHLGIIEGTNPCGEQPLLPYESCVLGSINLSKLIADGRLHYDRLKKLIWLGVRFLDDVLDVNRYILPEIEQASLGNRKIGLGVMGFADALLRMGIPYNSSQTLELIEELISFFAREATQASVALAEKRGVFPHFPYSLYHQPGMPRVRNATRTTIAPTGSLSLIAGCSSGIEPVYALAYQRLFREEGALTPMVHPLFLQVAQERGFYSQELVDRLIQGESLQRMKGIPQDVQALFVTAYDIHHEWHVRVQAAFQKYTDNAVSKTINFSRDASVEDVKEAILLAYRSGCLGITVYRDQSRVQQPLTASLKVG
ncbi:MAG: adenosylcobalamin-dependent ribonucleoside-diphosphate reductase [Candidatus Tectomicrobia bacterium]|uniref:Vitamin B12-dependent ribonucleotide reductase n=1 Tax=Tectimicrobiota bacterium TaxID=2528274 RepID=A0A932CP83_UNCTE|nr:adenosylcobalamin-dependent ribonucleoside-diphosphate reductase [Candidatus Tectomicrobia bacterium]